MTETMWMIVVFSLVGMFFVWLIWDLARSVNNTHPCAVCGKEIFECFQYCEVHRNSLSVKAKKVSVREEPPCYSDWEV